MFSSNQNRIYQAPAQAHIPVERIQQEHIEIPTRPSYATVDSSSDERETLREPPPVRIGATKQVPPRRPIYHTAPELRPLYPERAFAGVYDRQSRRRFERARITANSHNVNRETKSNFHRFGSSEHLWNRPVSAYYQNGEGVGDVEALLPEDSEDEGPRRWSSLGVQGGGCSHQWQRKKVRPSSKKVAEDSEKCECGEDKIPKFVKFKFALIRSGKFVQSLYVSYAYPSKDTQERTDAWLVGQMKTAYYRDLSYCLLVPMRKIGFATFIRIERLAKRKFGEQWEYPFYHTTAKIGFMRNAKAKSKSIFKRHLEYPEEENLAATERLWLAKFDKLIQAVDGDAEFIIELDEQMNFWFFFWLLILAILISVGAGVLYGVLRKDVATAVSLASYIVTCLALVLALIAAGDYVGIQKPTGEVNFDFNSETGDFDEATGEGLKDGLSPAAQARLMVSLRKKKSRGRQKSKPRSRSRNRGVGMAMAE